MSHPHPDCRKIHPSLSHHRYFVNGLAGIVTGIIANEAATAWPLTRMGGSSFYVGGVTVPFDMSFFCLAIGAMLVAFMWHGGTRKQTDSISFGFGSLPSAISWLSREPLILLLLVASACTEGAM